MHVQCTALLGGAKWRKLRISSLLFVEDIALVASLELFSAKYEPAVTQHLLGWGHILIQKRMECSIRLRKLLPKVEEFRNLVHEWAEKETDRWIGAESASEAVQFSLPLRDEKRWEVQSFRGPQSRAAAPLHLKKLFEVALISLWCLLGETNRHVHKEEPQEMLEGPC